MEESKAVRNLSKDNLKEFINKIKGSNFVSNIFMTIDAVEGLMRKPQTKVFATSDIMLIITDESDLFRLYYYARSLEFIEICLADANQSDIKKPLVCDIIGRKNHCVPISDQLVRNGFIHRYSFIRMSTYKPFLDFSSDVSGIEYAAPKDHIEINKMLMGEFSPVCAHFPNEEEISTAILNKDICVYRVMNKIAGFSYFEKTGRTICLKYLVVSEEYRGKGVAKQLLVFGYQNYKDILRYILWVGSDNKAQNLYKKIGFSEDGLVDEIMVLETAGQSHMRKGC